MTFETELLRHSESRELDSAFQEWHYLYETKGKPSTCICGRAVKNITFLYNRLNLDVIIVAGNCLKKFNIKHSCFTNIAEDILIENIKREEYILTDDDGEYNVIFNRKISCQIEEYFRKGVDSANTFWSWKRLAEEIENLNLPFLESMLEEVNKNIAIYHEKQRLESQEKAHNNIFQLYKKCLWEEEEVLRREEEEELKQRQNLRWEEKLKNLELELSNKK